MTTLIDLDGYAHQTVQTAQSGSGFIGTYDSVSGSANLTFDTTTKRLSEHVASLKIVQPGSVTNTRATRTLAAGNKLLVVSVYFNIAAAPSVASHFLYFPGPTNIGFVRMNTNGTISAVIGGTVQSATPNFADGVWHLLDIRMDTTGTTYLLDWYIDGIKQTQVSLGSQVATDMTSASVGSPTGSQTLTCWLQDYVLSATTADFPIGQHVVLPLYPIAEGTETLGSSNKIQDESAGQTNLWQKVDDWNGGTPNTSDYVTYASTTLGDAATNFAEFTFGAPVDVVIWNVMGYIAGFASGTNANTADTQILTAHGGTLISHIGNLIDYSGSTTVLGYYRQILNKIGGWTGASLKAAVAQWGFSNDTNPLPRLSAIMLEYAAPRARRTQQVSNNRAVIQRSSRW